MLKLPFSLKKFRSRPALLLLCLLMSAVFLAGYALQRELDQKQKSNTDYLALARQALSDKDLGQAEEYYLKVVNAASGDKTAWRELAGVYQKEDKKEEALKAFGNSLENSAADASALNSIANLHRDLRHFDQAEQAYLQAVKYNPNYLTAVINLAHLYELNGKSDQTVSLLEKYYDGSKTKGNIGLQLANSYKLSGRSDKAKKTVEMVLKADPDYEAAKNLLGRL